jgi:L-seryl-tRNA(Ser) seleniumtransferase
LRGIGALPVTVEIVALKSQIGSGSLPVDRLKGGVLNRIEGALRGAAHPLRPVIGRIEEGALLLDLRCLDLADEGEFAATLAGLRISP